MRASMAISAPSLFAKSVSAIGCKSSSIVSWMGLPGIASTLSSVRITLPTLLTTTRRMPSVPSI